MIKYVKGSIFDGKEDVIVHGCNCFQKFGSGVAKQIKDMYPSAYAADKQYKGIGDKSKLGEYSFVRMAGRTIINAYTQYTYGTEGVHIDYNALRTVMERINREFKHETLSMPKIGAGLAGGDWSVIEKILNDIFKDREIIVYVL